MCIARSFCFAVNFIIIKDGGHPQSPDSKIKITPGLGPVPVVLAEGSEFCQGKERTPPACSTTLSPGMDVG